MRKERTSIRRRFEGIIEPMHEYNQRPMGIRRLGDGSETEVALSIFLWGLDFLYLDALLQSFRAWQRNADFRLTVIDMLFFGLSVCESVIDSGRRIILSRGRVKNADVIVTSDLFVREGRTTREPRDTEDTTDNIRREEGTSFNV